MGAVTHETTWLSEGSAKRDFSCGHSDFYSGKKSLNLISSILVDTFQIDSQLSPDV